MAFRKEKGSDPFSQKTNRFDRFAQMSKQEEMIQQKKREIQAKLEAQKRKDAEDNTKKLSTTNLNNKPGNKKPIGKPISVRSIGSQLKSSSTTSPAASASTSQSSSSGALNIFSNDGSFMDQFRKLSGIKDSKHGGSKKDEFNSSQDDQPREKAEEREDQRRRERERDRERERERDKDRTRDRERDRERDRSRDRERDRDRENRERERDRDRCRERDRSRDRDSDRSRDHLRDRSHDRERDSYRSRREDRWQAPSAADVPHGSHAPRPSSPYSPTRVDFPPMFSTMYPPPNLSVPPPSSQPPFSQPPPSQPFISYPTSRAPPQQSNAPPPQAVPSVPPPSAPPPLALQLIPQPSPLQPHSIPPPSPLEPHLIPPPPMPPTGIPPPGMPGLPGLLPPRFQPPGHHSVPPPVPPPGVPPPGVPPPGVPPPGVPPPGVPPPGVPPPGVPPPGVPPPGVPPPGVPPPGVPPPGVPPPGVPPPTSVPPPVAAPTVRATIPSGVPPPALSRPPGVPPPGLPPGLPPGMPPGVPPPISHLTGVPPPSVVTSFPPLSVMPVPPPVVPAEVKPVEAPSVLSHSALHATASVITPVPPPLNGVMPTLKKKEDDDDAVLQLAKMVSQCGDDIEDIIKARNTDDAKLWFLHQKDSNAYIQYRQLVGRLRREAQRADDSDDEGDSYPDREHQKNLILKRSSPSYGKDNSHSHKNENGQPSNVLGGSSQGGESESSSAARKRKRRSRWAPEDTKSNTASMQLGSLPPTNVPPPGYQNVPLPALHGAGSGAGPALSRVTRTDPGLLRYAMQSFGTTNLSEEDWKKAEDHYKVNLLYQDLLKKREEIKKLEMKGKHKYDYDSDEECEGGTWEHKLRAAEMEATERWADELTRQSQGKHHIGDFLPPEELAKFMEKYSAMKEDREPDLSDYKEFKLKEDNIGFQMLQKLGWSEGQGLGSEGTGIVDPIGRANQRSENQGLGVDRPDEVSKEDDEFDAYRKRMMLAYRFRPNPLNNPRRPYY